MILVDTSIWVDHARKATPRLSTLLDRGEVLGHPFVVGELALGGFKSSTLRLLTDLPQAVVATDDEVLGLIGAGKFAGRGIGYVDAHILAAARLTDQARIWTRDRYMRDLAKEQGVIAPFEAE